MESEPRTHWIVRIFLSVFRFHADCIVSVTISQICLHRFLCRCGLWRWLLHSALLSFYVASIFCSCWQSGLSTDEAGRGELLLCHGDDRVFTCLPHIPCVWAYVLFKLPRQASLKKLRSNGKPLTLSSLGGLVFR